VDWNDVSRGMAEEAAGEPLRTIDEAGLRHFWRLWDDAVSGEASRRDHPFAASS
jgi:hypothetical protein